MFCDTLLAARIERAECQLLRDSARSCTQRNPDQDVQVLPIAGGVATWTGPGSPLNKLAGLGFGEELVDEQLAVVERAFEERATPLQVEVSTLGDPSIVRRLTERGYRLENFENVLGCPLGELSPSPSPSSEVRVEPCGEVDFEQWLDIVVTGFATPDVEGVASHETFPREVLEPIVRDMVAAEGFRLYLAYLEGRAVGGGSMRLHEGLAQLCGAATIPEARRRGVQSTLLDQRLVAAAGSGAEIALVTTQPGSRSQANVQHKGFVLLYTRAVLVRG